MRAKPFLIALICLAGCTSLPDVPMPDRLEDGGLEYPDFVPMRRVAYEQRADDARALETEEELQARLAVLRARTARLRAVPAG